MGKTLAIFLAVGLLAACASAERIELKRGDVSCTVETCGARVVSYCVRGRELLWMPGAGPKDDGCWRHGGIAVAWPWFGRLGEGDRRVHGYAWKSDFSVAERSASSVRLVLSGESADLEYAIRLDGSLELELKTRSKSDFELPLGVAFHPYFRVGERDAALVAGFGDGLVAVSNAVDRSVHFGSAQSRHLCILRDNARNVALHVVSEGATGLNLWNPGREKRCPGAIPGDEWRYFIAIEPFAMGVNRFLVLDPGEEHVLRMAVFPEESLSDEKK